MVWVKGTGTANEIVLLRNSSRVLSLMMHKPNHDYEYNPNLETFASRNFTKPQARTYLHIRT